MHSKLLTLILYCFFPILHTLKANGVNVYSYSIDANEITQKRTSYQSNLAKIEKYRKKQEQLYRNSSSAKKLSIVSETRKHLEKTLVQDVFPAWYGTDWAFHGTSLKPGEGSIACGYFVSTCLKHIGFKVERIKLAQQPSQRIIETFMTKKERDIFTGGKSIKIMKEYLRKKGNGIYIVGLDTHVGFVSAYGTDVAFIHSSYYKPGSVVKSEKIDTKNPFKDSQYRVFGKILSDKMIIGWLTGRTFRTKTK